MSQYSWFTVYLERIDSERNQIADIAIPTKDIVNSTTNTVTRSKQKFFPGLTEEIQFSIEIVLYQIDSLLIHLLTVAVDKFDPIVVIGIMTCRNHDTTIKLIHAGNVGHTSPPTREYLNI